MAVIVVCDLNLFLLFIARYLILSADLTSFSSAHIALYDMKYIAIANMGATDANSSSNFTLPPPST